MRVRQRTVIKRRKPDFRKSSADFQEETAALPDRLRAGEQKQTYREAHWHLPK